MTQVSAPDDEPTASGPLAGLVQAVAGRLLDHPRGKATQLARLWRQLVGPQLARHTEPVRLMNGELTVRVDSSAWLSELNFLAPDILLRFQEQLPAGTLKKFRFKQESLKFTPAPRSKPPPPREPPLPEELERAERLCAPITDPRLKETVRAFLLADMGTKRREGRRN